MLKIVPLVLFLISFLLPASAQETLWQPLALSDRGSSKAGNYYQLDMGQMRQSLSRVVLEGGPVELNEISLPVTNGIIERFHIVESPIMQAGLAAKYSEIKTYKIFGIDDPHASGRLSISEKGFHGMITSHKGTIYINPESNNVYRAFNRASEQQTEPFSCGVSGHSLDSPVDHNHAAERILNRSGGQLQTYELAVAGTSEYVAAVGGTVSQALSEVVIAINRVNQIYERDVSIRLILVDNTDDLLYDGSSGSDPYTNNDLFAMLDENQSNIDSVLGNGNYDIGHVFTTTGGGLASLGVACDSNFKAQGASGLSTPNNESFYIDILAHELGHQFNADHSFNGTSSSCGGGNRWAPTAFEPGSGTTIMAYSGVCGAENIPQTGNLTDALFHAGSISQIDAFVQSTAGGSCSEFFSISNNSSQPTVDAGSDVTIPTGTPFMLTATGSDSDGDSLSYTWDQIDTGTLTNSTTIGTDLVTNPLFRSFVPRAESFRHFPRLSDVLDGNSDIGETLPTQTREMNFTVTVRDGKGGYATDNIEVSADATGNQFRVTSQASNTTLAGNSTITVEWEVGNTNQSPINCSSMDISLLKMNAAQTTYCEEILATTIDNDGSHDVDLPNEFMTSARIKLSCNDNVFYALNAGNLALTGANAPTVDCNNVDPTAQTHNDVDIEITGTPSSGGGSSSSGGGGGSSSSGGGSSSGDGGSGGTSAWLLLLIIWIATFQFYHNANRRKS